jgi:hypothetical protein
MLYLLSLRQFLQGAWAFVKQLPMRWRELILGAAIALVGVLLFPRKPVPQPPPLIEVREVVRTETVEKEVVRWRDREVVKWRDRKVVVTKPDGTRVETTEVSSSQAVDREQSRSAVVEQRAEQERTVKVPVSVPDRRPYRVGLSINTEKDVVGSASARLGSSPVFLDLHVGTSYKGPTLRNSHVGLGLSLEF